MYVCIHERNRLVLYSLVWPCEENETSIATHSGGSAQITCLRMYVLTYTQKQTCTLTMQPRLNILLELTLNLSTIYSTTTSFLYTYVCSASLCIITSLYTNIHVCM